VFNTLNACVLFVSDPLRGLTAQWESRDLKKHSNVIGGTFFRPSSYRQFEVLCNFLKTRPVYLVTRSVFNASSVRYVLPLLISLIMSSKFCSSCAKKLPHANFLKDARSSPSSRVFATCIQCRTKSATAQKKRTALQALDPNVQPSRRVRICTGLLYSDLFYLY